MPSNLQRIAKRQRALLNRRSRPWWRGQSLLAYEPATVVTIMVLWIRGVCWGGWWCS